MSKKKEVLPPDLYARDGPDRYKDLSNAGFTTKPRKFSLSGNDNSVYGFSRFMFKNRRKGNVNKLGCALVGHYLQ
jgi:hypothetical protein